MPSPNAVKIGTQNGIFIREEGSQNLIIFSTDKVTFRPYGGDVTNATKVCLEIGPHTFYYELTDLVDINGNGQPSNMTDCMQWLMNLYK